MLREGVRISSSFTVEEQFLIPLQPVLFVISSNTKARLKGVGRGGREGAVEETEGLSLSWFHKRGGEEDMHLAGFITVLTEYFNSKGSLEAFELKD